MEIRLKRVYDAAQANDGHRVLVDRLWPRGLKKEEARLDAWMKDLAPSPALRKWFGHDPGKWEAFTRTYRMELEQSAVAGHLLESLTKQPVVTLLYAAKDTEHTHALVLKEFLRERAGGRKK